MSVDKILLYMHIEILLLTSSRMLFSPKSILLTSLVSGEFLMDIMIRRVLIFAIKKQEGAFTACSFFLETVVFDISEIWKYFHDY